MDLSFEFLYDIFITCRFRSLLPCGSSISEAPFQVQYEGNSLAQPAAIVTVA